MRIALIGTGNVAWHLAEACTAAGHNVVAVVGRTVASAAEFTRSYPGAAPATNQSIKDKSVDIVLIAVPDATLLQVTSNLEVQPGTVVAHTSGSQPVSILEKISGALPGVFYPVQTFTKFKEVDFTKVPVLIEGVNKEAENILMQLGETISENVQVVDSLTRKHLHLAAVFACNFTNHLFGISQSILQNSDLPTDLLQPLIEETVAKAGAHHPFTVQTGPASRNDRNVIQEHLRMLEGSKGWQELYQMLTQSIQEQQKKLNSSKENT